MSLRKKDVYSKLSDCGRKVLGKSLSSKQTILSDKSLSSKQTILSDKSLSPEKTILSDKSCSPEKTILSVKSRSKQAKSFNFVECGLAVKDCHTPPNSPNYKYIKNDILVKTIEEPYPILELNLHCNQINKNIEKPDTDRTIFQICKIM